MSEPRVLVYVPRGNGVSAERVFARPISIAREIVESGQEDRNGWFAGARAIDDPAEYPRYGYKECPINGVVRDDSAQHYTVTQLQRMEADNRRDTLTDATEASMKIQMSEMMSQMEAMKIQLDKTEQQRQMEADLLESQRKQDMEAAQKPKANKLKKKSEG